MCRELLGRRSSVCMPFLLVACLGTPTAGRTQELPLLSTEIELIDHGIDRPESIVRGEISIAWTDAGPQLAIARLRSRPPAVLPLSVTNAPPAFGASGCFDIDGVGLAGINALGGRFGAYGLGGASASADVGSDPQGRRVIAFQCDRSGGRSACGLWVQLFDPTDPVRTYLDASGGASLAMWVSRRPRGADVLFKVADAAWNRRDDAIEVASVNQFASAGVPGDAWHRLDVPLDALPVRLSRDSLATLVLEAGVPGHNEILVGGIQLCQERGRPKALHEPPAPLLPEGAGHKALWIWNTRQLLDDVSARSEFLDYVQERGFDRIFLQLVPEPGKYPERGFVPFNGQEMGPLVAELRARGALTYAMDGDPEYALARNHAGVLSTIRAIAEHNRRSPPQERFHGVHYDVEPYLLRGFHGPQQSTLLNGFVEVVAGISRIARAENLAVGVAVPFWLDATDWYTGEALTAELEGTRAPVLQHVVDLVDEVAVMDYRTTAAGSNGSVALVLDELEAARDAGIGVWVGVETAPLLDTDAMDFAGTPQKGLPAGDNGRWIVLEPLQDGKARFWFVPEGGLERLRRTLTVSGAATEALLSWRAGAPIRSAGDSQTYYRLGADRMEAEVGTMLTELASHPAFLGMAYHHYESLRALEEGRER